MTSHRYSFRSTVLLVIVIESLSIISLLIHALWLTKVAAILMLLLFVYVLLEMMFVRPREPPL